MQAVLLCVRHPVPRTRYHFLEAHSPLRPARSRHAASAAHGRHRRLYGRSSSSAMPSPLALRGRPSSITVLQRGAPVLRVFRGSLARPQAIRPPGIPAWIPCHLPGFGGSFAFDELKALNLSKPTYDCTPLRTEDAVVESVVETAVKDFAARYNAMVSFDQKVTATRSCVLRVCGFCELCERVRVGLLQQLCAGRLLRSHEGRRSQ
jgi:hypothetical protein